MIDILNTIASAWWGWMGPMFWQVSVLILVVGAIDRLIRSWAWPEVRHALWLLVVIKLLLPPQWSFPAGMLPRLTEPVRQFASAGLENWTPAASRTEDAARETGPKEATREPDAGTAGSRLVRRDPPQTSSPTWQLFAFGIWLAGIVSVSALLLSRTARLRRWHREQEETRTVPPWFLDQMVATAKRLKIERLPAIVFSDEVTAPAVYGLLHPVLLLPSDTENLSPREAEHVLLHELAHLKRGDLWLHGLCLGLQIVYWFNPLLIWSRRQIKHVRELCCDLTVANILREKTVEYRKTLLETARRLLSESTEPALALLGVFEEPFRLVSRLRWLERETWHRRTPALASGAMVLVLGVPLLLPMASAGDKGTLDTRHRASSSAAEPVVSPASTDRSRNSPPTGQAVYIRNEFVLEELVLGFAVRSRLAAVSETWVGNGMISTSERGKTVILDRPSGELTYVDHEHRFWTALQLPLDIEQAMCEHSLEKRHERRSSGEVTRTRRSRRILGRKCREYEVHSWHIRGDGAINTEERMKVWASPDVPFDLSLYTDMLYNLRVIYNRDPVFQSELEKIDGLQMGIELSEGNIFRSRRYADETVVLEARTPPPGVFSPPPDYERRDRIEEFDF